MYTPDAYYDSDFEDPPMDDDEAEARRHTTPDKPLKSVDAPVNGAKYDFVRIAMVLGRLAIVERETDEPIQFVSGAGRSSSELSAWAEKLAGQWEEHFVQHFERNRSTIRIA